MESYLARDRASRANDRDDDDLVSSAIGGDVEAYADLYERYLGRVYSYVYHRVGDGRLAEDLTQRTFLKVWEGLPRFRVGAVPFRLWLYRAARNLLIDHFRTRKPELLLTFDDSVIADPTPRPEDEVITREQWERVRGAIAQLRPEHQEVLLLRFLDGLSHAEVGQVLGLREPTVRVLQHRALKCLLEILAHDG